MTSKLPGLVTGTILDRPATSVFTRGIDEFTGYKIDTLVITGKRLQSQKISVPDQHFNDLMKKLEEIKGVKVDKIQDALPRNRDWRN